jgi:hypothetical protein
MAKAQKVKLPQPVQEYGPEYERKWKIKGKNFKTRVSKLSEIFNSVVACNSHFATLNKPPHTSAFEKELIDLALKPFETTPLRTRFYFSGKNLKGYIPQENCRTGEVRTERKVGKKAWQQVLKLGSGKTQVSLQRQEYKRLLDGFGVNLEAYPKKIAKAAVRVLGSRGFKRIIKVEGQSTKLLYHPDGDPKMLFEIKFDMAIARNFLGKRHDIVEIEIEVKEADVGVSKEKIEEALEKAHQKLSEMAEGSANPVKHSKIYPLIRHLAVQKRKNPKAFNKAFRELKPEAWV